MSFSGECLEGGVGVMYLSGSLRFRSPDSFQIFLNQYNIILTLKVQTHYQNSSVIIKLKLLQAPSLAVYLTMNVLYLLGMKNSFKKLYPL